jgi:uncharacterized Zn finger protein
MSWGQQWAPYVSVGEKLNKAAKKAAALAKKQKREPAPVKIQGRNIAKTFWGKAWCDNLTAYQDYSNRLPRGATYVRNGSVVDLVIHPKKIEAIVAGSDPYTVKIEITALDSKRWKAIRSECSESIDSLLDLLSGKLSDGVMKRLTDQKTGLFPAPREIKMSCSCPDYSSCCKHLAAVMYGIGARLDSQPELLFLLRGVDHQELVSQAIAAGNLDRELSNSGSGGLDSNDLGAIFGIELDSVVSEVAKPAKKKRTPKKAAAEPAPTAAASKTLESKSKSRKALAEALASKAAALKESLKSSRAKATVKSAKKKTASVKTTKRSQKS